MLATATEMAAANGLNAIFATNTFSADITEEKKTIQ